MGATFDAAGAERLGEQRRRRLAPCADAAVGFVAPVPAPALLGRRIADGRRCSALRARSRSGTPGTSNETPLYDRPAWVYREPARMKLTAADRKELFNTAAHFI